VDSEATTFAMAGVNLGATFYTTATGSDIKTAATASTALTNVKAAIDQLATDRATVGANNARLKYTSEQLSILNTNLTASNSRIKDVDVAEESTQFARYNILVQAGTAMLAQANASPQYALRLLQ
jgi:flagellin